MPIRNCHSILFPRRLLIAILVALLCAEALADVPRVPQTGACIVGRFTVGTSGRPLLLPVEISGREILCLLDTGATCTAFDISLRDALGPSQSDTLVHTAAGTTTATKHEWPDAKIGGTPIALDSLVACVDLSLLRLASNAEIRGIIGMDVLRSCRCFIDFDRGLIQFVNALPANDRELGARIELQFRADGTPLATASFDGNEPQEFVIDTGADSASVQADCFDALLGEKRIQLTAAFSAATATGLVRGEQGRIPSLSIGPFTHTGIRVSRMHESSLGLRYLSRYQVVFDFPGSAMYLRKGRSFDKAEPAATCGMSLLWIDGEICVNSVRKDGPAARAGIREGDILAVIDQKPASDFDAFNLRTLMTSEPNVQVPMIVLRGESEIEVQLVTDED